MVRLSKRMVLLGVAKLVERQMAIDLRAKGHTYSEILKLVPVAKSSLSLWLRSEKLSVRQKQRITEKKRLAMLRGSAARRKERIERTARIFKEAKREMNGFVIDPLFLIGLTLYWAEGTKQKEWNIGQMVSFSNMDPVTHTLMLSWFDKYFKRKKSDLVFQIYIHESADISKAKKYWSSIVGVPYGKFTVYLKKNNPVSKRHNKGPNYHGVLKIVVPKSVDMNRRIAAWTDSMLQFAT